MKRILITSGGTKIPIDEVRDITNMSSGTFASKIASEFLNLGHCVHFVRAKGSKSPMSCSIDMLLAPEQAFKDIGDVVSRWHSYSSIYHGYQYKTFQDYFELLRKLLTTEAWDIVVLAAAVSDYEAQPMQGKVRSKENLTIQL